MGSNVEQGVISRIAAGVRYAITGVGPENWFGPMQPLAPQAQDKTEGRQFDYPVGVNLRIQPRSEEVVGFWQLRGLADGYDLLRLIIETRKDQIEAFEWEITPKDSDVDAETLKSEITAATSFLQMPDQENDWPEWIRQLTEEILVTDAACVYPRMNRGGKLYGLELLDGATIKRLLDDGGRTPLPPSPAYQQVLKGIPASDYTREELMYMPRNQRVWKIYGYSPVEQVIMTVNIALRRQMSQLQFYTEGNIPEAIAQLPKDWTPQVVKEFQSWWDSLMEGNTAQRRKMKFIPNIEGILFPKQDILKDEYDEWLARICCFAFSIPPTAFVKQQNRATAEQAADTAKEEGLAPLLKWLANKLTRMLQGPMGYPQLEFKWKISNKVDPKSQAETEQIYVNMKALTPDEVRADTLGKDALTQEQKDAAWPAPPPPPEQPVGKTDPLTGLPYKEPVAPQHPEAAEKLAKAEPERIHVEVHPPAIQMGDTFVRIMPAEAPITHVHTGAVTNNQLPAAPVVLPQSRTVIAKRLPDGSMVAEVTTTLEKKDE